MGRSCTTIAVCVVAAWIEGAASADFSVPSDSRTSHGVVFCVLPGCTVPTLFVPVFSPTTPVPFVGNSTRSAPVAVPLPVTAATPACWLTLTPVPETMLSSVASEVAAAARLPPVSSASAEVFRLVPASAVTVPLTGCVTALPSTFHAVVLAVFPGCTVHVPDCVAATVHGPACRAIV